MRLLIAFVLIITCFDGKSQSIQYQLADKPTTDTLKSGTVTLPGVIVSAHQQLTTLSSKGKRYTTGVAIEPGRQIAVYYRNPDTLKTHMVKGISVLIERKFTYGRLKVNLRLLKNGVPTEKNELPTAYYIVPELITGHHTWVSFTLPDGFILPKNGVFVSIEGMTASDEEKNAGITTFIKKATTSDGSSRVSLSLRIQDGSGKERLVSLTECPNLITSVLADGIDSDTWIKISPNPRFTFKRNTPTKVGDRIATSYNFATQLTLVSW